MKLKEISVEGKSLRELSAQIKVYGKQLREVNIVLTARVKFDNDVEKTDKFLIKKYGEAKAKFLVEQYVNTLERDSNFI